MSGDTAWCYEDQPAAEAAARMRQRQLRRMPVVDRDRRLVGIVSLGDLAMKANEEAAAGDPLPDVSTPSRPVG
jgi:CBS-domain-containing membrane protein